MIQRSALGVGILGLTAWAFIAPNAKLFIEPELARMIFFHLPCAFLSVCFLIATMVASIRFLRGKKLIDDVKASALAEMTLTLMVLALLTGILFSRAQWNQWWHNDPRQTSFLIATLMFGSYFLLRMSQTDDIKRATTSAAYCVSMALPILFLVFVYPRLPQVKSVHPTNTIQDNLLKGEYGTITLLMFCALGLYTIWLVRTRVRVDLLTTEITNEQLDHGGGSTPTGVVRPISLPTED